MLNLETINKEILDLEHRDTTYATCERLAWLYIVKDHLQHEEQPIKAAPIQTMTPLDGSEFLQVASSVKWDDLLNVLNEHMEAIKIVYPKEYDALIAKIKALQ